MISNRLYMWHFRMSSYQFWMFGKAQGVGEQNLQIYIYHIIVINCCSGMEWGKIAVDLCSS